MLKIVCALVLLLSLGQDDARILGTGDPGARGQALARILAIPPAARGADVWLALRTEVERLATCLDVTKPSPEQSLALQCDLPPHADGETYMPDLIEGLSQSRDPAMIPTLIKVAPGGAGSGVALARFGDLALPALIESALGSRTGPWVSEAPGAIRVLALMLEHPADDPVQPLTDAGRHQIHNTATTLLHTRLTWVNQISIVHLALATNDQVLRSEVEALATDASEWERRGTDPARITQAQNSIRAQLRRYPKP